MREEDYRRKMKAKKRKKRRRKLMRIAMIMILIILLGIVGIIGYFAIGTVRQMFFNKVDIVLDAWHGGEDPGANRGDAVEKEITLEVAEMTKAILEESDYKVGMTRDTDCYIELGKRAKFANERKAKVFVSIHCNSSEDYSGKGIETYYTEQKGLEDEILAGMIQESLINQTDANDRGIKVANYTVIVRSDMPAVLVEVGFLTDAEEKEQLQEEAYQRKLARGIAEGVKRYLESLEAE
jgi:N-acetylmuramoyl-L-alanine amidase